MLQCIVVNQTIHSIYIHFAETQIRREMETKQNLIPFGYRVKYATSWWMNILENKKRWKKIGKKWKEQQQQKKQTVSTWWPLVMAIFYHCVCHQYSSIFTLTQGLMNSSNHSIVSISNNHKFKSCNQRAKKKKWNFYILK